jgi:hypothetical protein
MSRPDVQAAHPMSVTGHKELQDDATDGLIQFRGLLAAHPPRRPNMSHSAPSSRVAAIPGNE